MELGGLMLRSHHLAVWQYTNKKLFFSMYIAILPDDEISTSNHPIP